MSDQSIILLIGSILALLLVFPFFRRQRQIERKTEEAELQAIRYGLHEPASLHPVVDPEKCIGTAGCINVCPEDVLGLRNGQGIAVAPARCVGHGLCERACPVDAIQLVFGTEKRGVEIPRIKENFESNVDGIFIIGELGGMGLISNAFEQARQCVAGIRKSLSDTSSAPYDVVIVGSGPAGFAASMYCQQLGLSYVTLEKEASLGGTVRQYPRKKLVMTQPLILPGFGKSAAREIQKEELIEWWDQANSALGLNLIYNQTVSAIRPQTNGNFLVATNSNTFQARKVILAIGRRGIPRKLDCPVSDHARLYYALREPEHFAESRIMVVGGGDSAVEAAIALSEQRGNHVSLSYRRSQLSRVKSANRVRFDEAVAKNRINPYWETQPAAILNNTVTLQSDGGREIVIPSDDVFVFIGGTLPDAFLKSCGIEMDVKYGQP